MKILVLRGGALGDFIVTLPALASLRQRWPAAHVTLIGNARAAELARGRGLLDAVFSQNDSRWGALFAEQPMTGALREWLAAFDLVLNYWPDPDGAIAAKFPLREGQIFLWAPAQPTRAPAAAHYCEPLRSLGLETDNYLRLLRRVGDNAAYPIGERSGPIAIHPGSGSPRKNWPIDRWRELIPLLPPPITLIFGEAELERDDAASLLGWARTQSSLRVMVTPPLEELITLLSQSQLYLGHDSGVSHLAAACGVRCVLLFGSSDAKVWAPPAPNVQVLQSSADLRSISVEAVRSAAAAALADQT